MSSLGSLVVKLALEMAGYKSGLDDAATQTEKAAGRMQKAGEQTRDAAGLVKDAMAGNVGAALEVAQALGVAGAAVGVTAAAVAAAGYAYYQGAQESKAFEKAMILTGDAAGVTAGQMHAMADGIDKVIGTHAGAVQALTAMASGGRVARGELQGFTQTALEMERYVGTSVSDTVKVFGELADSPVKASIKLNESLNYLTAATFEQIKAAQDMGDHERAASLAQEAYADAMHARAERLKGDLGILERAWLEVKGAILEVKDAALNIGRPTGVDKQLAEAEATLERMKNGSAGGKFGQAGIDRQQEIVAGLTKQLLMQDKVAQAEADQVATQKAKIGWMQEGDKYLTKELKLQQEIAQIKKSGAAAGMDEEAISKRVKMAEERAATKEAKAIHEKASAYDRLMKSISEKIAVDQLDIETDGKLSAAQKEAVKVLDDVRTGALELTETEKQGLAVKLQTRIETEQKRIATEREAKAAADAAAAHQKFISGLDKELDTLQQDSQKLEEHNERLGLSRVAIAELDAAKLESMATAQDLIVFKKMELDVDKEQYQVYVQMAEEYRRQAKLKRDGAIKEEGIESVKAVNEEWKRGWNETDRLAREVFTSWAADGEGAAKKIGDTLKKALLSAIYEATLKPLVMQVYTSLVGAAPGGAGTGAAGTINTASNLNSLWGAGSQFFGGATAGASGASLAYANGVGMVGGDSIGALYSANGGWAGVSTGAAGSGATAAGGGFMGVPVAGWIALGMIASGQAYDQGVRSDMSAKGTNVLNPNHLLNFTDSALQGLGLDPKTAAILSGSSLGAAAEHFVFGGSTVSALGSGVQGTVGGSGSHLATYDAYKQDHRGVLGIGSYTTENRENWREATGTMEYVDGVTKLVTTSVKGYAQALGLATDGVDSYTKQIDVSLAGLDPAHQKEAIDKAIAGYGEDMVSSLYGDALKGLAKDGETSGATLQRVATDLIGVNEMFAQLHETLLPVGVSGAAAAASLVDTFGGLDKMQSAVGAYYEKFYSDSERAASSMEGVNAAFEKLGVAAPQSKEQFRALVDSIDLTTDSGRTLYAAVINLAPAFDAAAQAAQVASNNMLSAIQNWGTSADVRAFKGQQLQQLLANGGLTVDMNTLMGATKDQVLEYYKSLSDNDPIKKLLYDNQQTIYDFVTSGQSATSQTGGSYASAGSAGGGDGGSDALSDWKRATQAIVDTMTDLRSTLIDTGTDSFERLQAQFAIEVAQAKAGSLQAMQDLPNLAKSLKSAGDARHLSSVDRAVLSGQIIEALAGVAGVSTGAPTISIPSFDVGTDRVPYDMLAMVHKDERITPAAFNPTLAEQQAASGGAGGGSSDPAVVALLRSVESKMASLLAVQRDGVLPAAQMAAKNMDMLVTQQRPIRTKAVTS